MQIHSYTCICIFVKGFSGTKCILSLDPLIDLFNTCMHALHTYATHWSILFCTYLLHRDTCNCTYLLHRDTSNSTSFEALKCPKNMTLSETMCLTDCMGWFKYLWCVCQLLTCWIGSLFYLLQLFGPFAQPLHFFVHPFARKKVNHGWWTDVSMSRAGTNSFEGETCWENRQFLLPRFYWNGLNTLLGTNISPFQKAFWRFMFLFSRWDMLVPWRIVKLLGKVYVTWFYCVPLDRLFCQCLGNLGDPKEGTVEVSLSFLRDAPLFLFIGENLYGHAWIQTEREAYICTYRI